MAEKPSLLEQIVANTSTIQTLGKVNWDAVGGVWGTFLAQYKDDEKLEKLLSYLGSFVQQYLNNSKALSSLTRGAYSDWLRMINIDRAMSELSKRINKSYEKLKTPEEKAAFITNLYPATEVKAG